MSTTILLWLMFNTLMMVAMHQIPIVIHVGGDYSVATNMTGFPYKPIYGLPDHLNCAHELRKEFYECENYAKQSWLITLDEYFYPTQKFCCFVWQQMECEIPVARKCQQQQYSELIEQKTLQMFEQICQSKSFGRSSFFCWFTEDRKDICIIVAIALILMMIVGCIIGCITKRFNSSNIVGGKNLEKIGFPVKTLKQLPPPPPPSSSTTTTTVVEPTTTAMNIVAKPPVITKTAMPTTVIELGTKGVHGTTTMENIPKLTSSTKTVVKPMVEMVVARPPSATIVKPTITTVGGAESVHGTTLKQTLYSTNTIENIPKPTTSAATLVKPTVEMVPRPPSPHATTIVEPTVKMMPRPPSPHATTIVEPTVEMVARPPSPHATTIVEPTVEMVPRPPSPHATTIVEPTVEMVPRPPSPHATTIVEPTVEMVPRPPSPHATTIVEPTVEMMARPLSPPMTTALESVPETIPQFSESDQPRMLTEAEYEEFLSLPEIPLNWNPVLPKVPKVKEPLKQIELSIYSKINRHHVPEIRGWKPSLSTIPEEPPTGKQRYRKLFRRTKPKKIIKSKIFGNSPPSSLSPKRSTTTVGGKPGSKLKITSPSKKTISKISGKSPSSSSMVPQQQQQNMTEQPITLTYGRGKFVTQITSNVSQLPSAFNFDATKFD
ncbi:hypothetical protein HUG17_2904 [Dermatophagoides farinae]|uniref:Uncharacterized protein n=1 Tax=Dermatophagoides farinae TaxID=6954 RepID=A0A9D4SEL9_DERFA|nr:hypothetical protein HUG17_2904 [Dermatophagoides farinae]